MSSGKWGGARGRRNAIMAQAPLIVGSDLDRIKRASAEDDRVSVWAMLDSDRFWRHYDSLEPIARVRLETALFVLADQLKGAKP